MKREIALGVVSLFLFQSSLWPSPHSGGDSVKTNSELFREGLIALVDSLLNIPSIPTGSELVLSVTGTDEKDFVQQTVIASLHHRGFEIYTDSGQTRLIPLFLMMNNVELRVAYHGNFHETFLGEMKTIREISITLPYVLSDTKNGKALQSENLFFHRADTVSTEMVPLLEQSQFPSSKAQLPERSMFDRLIEPLVIIGATGVAVYLFFHIRS